MSSHCSVVIEVRNSAIGCNLRVNVTSLALVEIDLCLENVDFFRLALKLGLEEFLLLLTLAFLFIVFVHKDLFVRAVKFAVKFKLLLTERPDQVQEICVSLDALCQFTLGLLKVSLSLFLLRIAALLLLVELILKFKHLSRRSTHFKRVKIDQVSEPKHLTFVVFSLLIQQVFLRKSVVFLLRLGIQLGLILVLLEVVDFFI